MFRGNRKEKKKDAETKLRELTAATLNDEPVGGDSPEQ